MNIVFSPYIVPLGAFAVAIVAIISGIVSQAHAARLKAEQRMAMITRGASVDEIERLLGRKDEPESVRPPKDPLRSLANARRAGIVLIFSGLALSSSSLPSLSSSANARFSPAAPSDSSRS